MKLFTVTINGNLHAASVVINKHYPKIIPGIVAMECSAPSSLQLQRRTVVVYRAEHDLTPLVPQVKESA